MLLDALGGVGHLDVGSLDDMPYPAEAPAHLGELLDGLQLVTLLAGHAVHLFVDQLHEIPDVASVRMLSRISSTKTARSAGRRVLRVPFPFLSKEWQT